MLGVVDGTVFATRRRRRRQKITKQQQRNRTKKATGGTELEISHFLKTIFICCVTRYDTTDYAPS